MFDINTSPMSKSDITTQTDELKNSFARIKRLRLIASAAWLIAGVVLICFFLVFGKPVDGFIFAFSFSGAIAFVFAGAFTVTDIDTHVGVYIGNGVVAGLVAGVVAGGTIHGGVLAISGPAAFFGAAALSGTASYVLHRISANLEFYSKKISSLSPISESDCPKLVEIAQRRDEVKAYIKAVSTLDRMPIQGEFEMLCGFDKDYEKIVQDKDSEESARKACEAICAGQI